MEKEEEEEEEEKEEEKEEEEEEEEKEEEEKIAEIPTPNQESFKLLGEEETHTATYFSPN